MTSEGSRPKHRDIRRSALFQLQASIIQPKSARFEEQIRSLEFAISRAADAWPPIPRTNLRVVKTDRFPGAPRLRVYFTIDDDDDCTLQQIELLEGPAEVDDPQST